MLTSFSALVVSEVIIPSQLSSECVNVRSNEALADLYAVAKDPGPTSQRQTALTWPLITPFRSSHRGLCCYGFRGRGGRGSHWWSEVTAEQSWERACFMRSSASAA